MAGAYDLTSDELETLVERRAEIMGPSMDELAGQKAMLEGKVEDIIKAGNSEDGNKKLAALCQAYKDGDTDSFIKYLKKVNSADWVMGRPTVMKAFGCSKREANAIRKEFGWKGAKPERGNLDSAGTYFAWDEPEPWEKEVNGAALLDEMVVFAREYLVLDLEDVKLVALWCLMTWVHSDLEIAPFLHITSATKSCGKTTILNVIEIFTIKPFRLNGVTSEAQLIRLCHLFNKTIIWDETDGLFKIDPVIRAAFNGAHLKKSAQAVRCGPAEDLDNLKVYSTWTPKVICGLGWIPETIASRCLKITVRRRAPGVKKPARCRFMNEERVYIIQRKIVRWIADNKRKILSGLEMISIDERFDDRIADNFEALTGVAAQAGGAWPDFIAAACEQANADVEETEFSVLLISDIYELRQSEKANYIEGQAPDHFFSREIVERLKNLEDRPYFDYNFTPNRLATMLKTFGIVPSQIKVSGKNKRGYRYENFRKEWNRYEIAPLTPIQTATSLPLASSLGHSQSQGATFIEKVAVQNALKAPSGPKGSEVAVQIPPNSEKSKKSEILV